MRVVASKGDWRNQMKFVKEDQEYVYACCKQCEKEYKLKWNMLERTYDGYKLKHMAICNCGEPLKRIEGSGEAVYCPACAHLNPVIVEYCQACGQKIEHESTKESKRNQYLFIAGIIVVLGILMVIAASFNKQYIWSFSKEGYSSVTDPSKIKSPNVLGDLYIEDQYGNYLGRLTINKKDEYSVFNPDSIYGYAESGISIWNREGTFGREDSNESVYNKNATKPPKIMYHGKFLGYLTANEEIEGMVVKPEELYIWLENNMKLP